MKLQDLCDLAWSEGFDGFHMCKHLLDGLTDYNNTNGKMTAFSRLRGVAEVRLDDHALAFARAASALLLSPLSQAS